jgi:hypothetical protein
MVITTSDAPESENRHTALNITRQILKQTRVKLSETQTATAAQVSPARLRPSFSGGVVANALR